MIPRLPFAAQFVVGLVVFLALAVPLALVCAAGLGLVR